MMKPGEMIPTGYVHRYTDWRSHLDTRWCVWWPSGKLHRRERHVYFSLVLKLWGEMWLHSFPETTKSLSCSSYTSDVLHWPCWIIILLYFLFLPARMTRCHFLQPATPNKWGALLKFPLLGSSQFVSMTPVFIFFCGFFQSLNLVFSMHTSMKIFRGKFSPTPNVPFLSLWPVDWQTDCLSIQMVLSCGDISCKDFCLIFLIVVLYWILFILCNLSLLICYKHYSVVLFSISLCIVFIVVFLLSYFYFYHQMDFILFIILH